MNTKNLRVALIGCGRMGLHHAKAIGVVENAELVAVADPHADLAAAQAALPAGVKTYSDPAVMLREMQPDVVHVVTPPETHVDLARLALEHGAHVYVEKPFALSSEAAASLVRLARERQRKLCPGHQVLFQDSGRRYSEVVSQIGRVVHVESYFSFKTVRRAAGGGLYSPVEQLVDILPHPVYLMLSAFEAGGGDATMPVRVQSVEVDARGEIRALIQQGDMQGVLIVTLRGRPIESYLRVVGTNGSIFADFVLSGVAKHIGPGASAISAVLNPFSRARQMVVGTISNIFRMVFRKHKSYSGLAELITAFYGSVRADLPSPVSDAAIVATVDICEQIGKRLDVAEAASEASAKQRLQETEQHLPAKNPQHGTILVTGGTGFLGRILAEELRQRRWPVRVLARRLPSVAARIPGVEYVLGDVSQAIPPEALRGVSVVAHLAAETHGGKEAHERNTIQATRVVLEAMARAGIKQLIHTGSIAVLKPRRWLGRALSESSPVDRDNLGRGPYVWAKAKAEAMIEQFGAEHGIAWRNIRLGPLVDFEQFTPPGRLGREVGPWYVAAGLPGGRLSVCDVRTASNVVRYCAEHFERAPAQLNLVEAQIPTRGELAARLRRARPDLSFFWLPLPVIWLLSQTLKLALRLLKPGKKPLDLYSAFAAERYSNALAAKVIAEARAPSPASIAERTAADRAVANA